MWLGYCNLLGLKLLLRPQQRNGGIVMNVYVCLSLCLSVRSRISEITIQSTKFSVFTARAHCLAREHG